MMSVTHRISWYGILHDDVLTDDLMTMQEAWPVNLQITLPDVWHVAKTFVLRTIFRDASGLPQIIPQACDTGGDGDVDDLAVLVLPNRW